jgi:tRNA-uridine 2-sulfurtransferase
MKRSYCLLLFSGGLDSILAFKLLSGQNINVTGICFKSSFYDCLKARQSANSIGMELIEKDISEEMLMITMNPPSGYGKNMNPCIDCHALMIRTASEYLKNANTNDSKNKYDFVATGEVLGQRPFSQNKEALSRVQKLAGCEVLRPLSAKLLPETNIEKSGLADRKRLLSICGRGREAQFESVKTYGIIDYPTPAGGCLLTDQAFSSRLLEMIGFWQKPSDNDIGLLKNGRIYWRKLEYFSTPNEGSAIIAVGRNDKENNNLTGLLQKGDFMLKLKEITGPCTLVRIKGEELKECSFEESIMEVDIPEILDNDVLIKITPKSISELLAQAALLTGYYSVKARGNTVKVVINKEA